MSQQAKDDIDKPKMKSLDDLLQELDAVDVEEENAAEAILDHLLDEDEGGAEEYLSDEASSAALHDSVEDCTVCPAGTYLSDEASSAALHDSVEDCTVCPAGTYLSDEASSAALHDSVEDCSGFCPAGTYLSDEASSAALHDSVEDSGSDTCFLCSTGEYNDLEGSVSCTKCSGGYYLNTGRTECLACEDGKYSNPGATACTACEDTEGWVSKSNKHNNATRNSCEYCGPGEFANIAIHECGTCQPGEFSVGGANSCEQCEVGSTYQPAGGKSSCLACTSCGVGRYRTKDCTATSDSECAACAPGKASTGGETECNVCGSGEYAEEGAGFCSTVRAGEEVVKDGELRAKTMAQGELAELDDNNGELSVFDALDTVTEKANSLDTGEKVHSGARGEFALNQTITRVRVGEGVKKVGASAFNFCSRLEEFDMGSAEVVGERAFFKCSSLKEVKLSMSLRSVERSAFQFCNSLTRVAVPDSLRSIGPYAFASCPDLVDIYLPESVTSVDTAAFKGCVRLEERAAKVELTVEQYLRILPNFHPAITACLDENADGVARHVASATEMELAPGCNRPLLHFVCMMPALATPKLVKAIVAAAPESKEMRDATKKRAVEYAQKSGSS
ncbi:hypothetical protein TeGR_g14465, partial [Tetraparma gracilis]